MADEVLQTGCCCGIPACCEGPTEPGHNDELDLEFMRAVLKAAHDLVEDPESGWRKKYQNVQQLRKYVRYFVSEQLRSFDKAEPADPNMDKPTAETLVTDGVENTSCAICRANYYACMQQVPRPPDCYDNYVICVAEPCI